MVCVPGAYRVPRKSLRNVCVNDAKALLDGPIDVQDTGINLHPRKDQLAHQISASSTSQHRPYQQPKREEKAAFSKRKKGQMYQQGIVKRDSICMRVRLGSYRRPLLLPFARKRICVYFSDTSLRFKGLYIPWILLRTGHGLETLRFLLSCSRLCIVVRAAASRWGLWKHTWLLLDVQTTLISCRGG